MKEDFFINYNFYLYLIALNRRNSIEMPKITEKGKKFFKKQRKLEDRKKYDNWDLIAKLFDGAGR